MIVVPHIWQAWARQDLTEIAAVITPGMKTNILAPAILKTKILKDSKKGLLEVYQPISSNPQGSQGTGYTHEPRGSSLRIPDPCLGKPTAFSTSSSSHPAAKGTRNHGLEAHLQLQIGKHHKVATTQAGGMALSPCHRFLNVDSNMETGIQKQGESWTLENHAAWSHL